MAARRMFSKMIIDNDVFLDMPLSTQALYFHLGLEPRNKGIINNARSITRSIGATNEDLERLFEKGYLKDLGNGYVEIVHWYENNGIGETAKKRNNYKYRQWRKAVIERDGGTCQLCGSKRNLVVHHIKHFATYPLLRTELSNGITLCDKCHKNLHKEERDVRCKMD